MSNQKTLILLVAALSASQAAAQVTYLWGVNMNNKTFRRAGVGGAWQYVPGPDMKQVSIGADGTLWALNTSVAGILRWSGSGWDPVPGQLKQISVGSAEHIWGVNAANEVFRWNGSGWTRMPGALNHVSAGSDGTVWGVNAAGNVYRWTGSTWEPVPGQLKNISVGSADHVWGTNFQDRIFRRTGSGWQVLDGLLEQVSVSAEGKVWGVNSANNIFYWTGTTWQVIDGLLTDISTGPTVSEPHQVFGSQIWLDAASPAVTGSTTSPVAACPAGWRSPTKEDLANLLEYAQSTGNATTFLTSATGFKAAAGDAIVSSTKAFPTAINGSDPNAWMFSALIVSPASVTNFATNNPGSKRMVSRCIRAVPGTPGAGDLSSCTAGFGSPIQARTVNVSSIQISDLARQAKEPVVSFSNTNPWLAPITADPQGGGYLLWTSNANKAMLTRIDADGGAVGTASDEDLGPAVSTGALGMNGSTIGYLLKSGPHKLEFRIKGGTSVVIMDNVVATGAFNAPTTPVLYRQGLRFNDSQGKPVYGTEAMYYPMELHRGSLLSGGGKWFATFDHFNNFNAISNPGTANGHSGAGMVAFNGDGSQPSLTYGWGASHSTDMRALSDGERIISIHLGDAYPRGLDMRVTDTQTSGLVQGKALFSDGRFPDTRIGLENNAPYFGIAGDGAGQSAGKLGDLVQTGCGQYALTYTIRPAAFTFLGSPMTSTPDELGLLVVDKDANVISRTKLRIGSDIETLKSARYGKDAILVAWKTNNAADYWMMLIDANGNVLQGAQKLPPGVVFSSRDAFTMMKDGDIVWTSTVGANLKLFRLEAPQ